MNTKPKFVALRTLTNPAWSGTTVLPGDIIQEIRRLKQQVGGELQVHGSGSLVRWLLQNDLVDDFTLLVCPVIVGQGAKLFEPVGPDLALELIESRVYPKGIILQTYRPAGRPQYAR